MHVPKPKVVECLADLQLLASKSIYSFIHPKRTNIVKTKTKNATIAGISVVMRYLLTFHTAWPQECNRTTTVAAIRRIQDHKVQFKVVPT